jgi:hypothetical protein
LEAARNNPLASPSQISQLESILNYWQNTTVAIGSARALGQGKTEGVWDSKTSHLNSKKVIQDSDFYQDFSYQITSKLSPSVYVGPLKNIAHVAGTKVFHKFSLEEEINTELDVSLQIVKYVYSPVDFAAEDNRLIVTEDGRHLTGTRTNITITEG